MDIGPNKPGSVQSGLLARSSARTAEARTPTMHKRDDHAWRERNKKQLDSTSTYRDQVTVRRGEPLKSSPEGGAAEVLEEGYQELSALSEAVKCSSKLKGTTGSSGESDYGRGPRTT